MLNRDFPETGHYSLVYDDNQNEKHIRNALRSELYNTVHRIYTVSGRNSGV